MMEVVRKATEMILLCLPLITFIYLEIVDYVTTIQAHALGARELNPLARELLEKGDFNELLHLKAIHLLVSVFIYVAGLAAVYLGAQRDIPYLESFGFTLILIFLVVYIVGLIVAFLNTTTIFSIYMTNIVK